MTIPLPGAGFFYSALKDLRGWVPTWLRGRRLTPDVFRGWTVDKWYHPYLAIRKFGDQQWLRQLDVTSKTHEELAAHAKLILERPEKRNRYEALREQYEKADDHIANLIYQDLEQQLTSGELIARGFREPLSHGAPYLTISRHEWRVITLKLPDHAEGGGIGYAGLTIGKPGTKRLFRPGR